MGFRLVPKSVILNDLERRNGGLVCIILLNSVVLGPYLGTCEASKFDSSSNRTSDS